MYCVVPSYANLFALFSHFPIGYGPTLLHSREINLGVARRGPDQIGGHSDGIGAFGGVLKLWRTFGAPWSILRGLDQRRASSRSVITLENPFGRGPFHFELLSEDRFVF